MKTKIYIFVSVLAIALCYTLDIRVHTDAAERETAALHEDTLTGNGETSDKYVDYNLAFCSGGPATGISSQRNSNSSNIPRNPGFGKRAHDPDNSSLVPVKAGKLICISAFNNFRSGILLYPSGLFSDSHRFIQLCRLTI